MSNPGAKTDTDRLALIDELVRFRDSNYHRVLIDASQLSPRTRHLAVNMLPAELMTSTDPPKLEETVRAPEVAHQQAEQASDGRQRRLGDDLDLHPRPASGPRVGTDNGIVPALGPRVTQRRERKPAGSKQPPVIALQPAQPVMGISGQAPAVPSRTTVQRDSTKAAALDITNTIIPLEHPHADDRAQALANSAGWIQYIMRTFNVRIPSSPMPKHWSAELRPRWGQWESSYAEEIRKVLANSQQPGLLQARATLLFDEVLEIHGVTADGRPGVRLNGIRGFPNLSLSCIDRLHRIVVAMETLACIRYDVIMGSTLPELIADPDQYVVNKVSQKFDQEMARPEFSHLSKQTRPPGPFDGRKTKKDDQQDAE